MKHSMIAIAAVAAISSPYSVFAQAEVPATQSEAVTEETAATESSDSTVAGEAAGKAAKTAPTPAPSATHAGDAAGQVTATEAALSQTPKQVCDTLIQAAKSDDFKTVQLNTRAWDHGGRSQRAGRAAGKSGMGANSSDLGRFEQGFHKMVQKNMAQLKEISCGSETVAGEAAMVVAEGKDSKRLIPFTQEGGKWKFDARAYMSLYRDAMPEGGRPGA